MCVRREVVYVHSNSMSLCMRRPFVDVCERVVVWVLVSVSLKWRMCGWSISGHVHVNVYVSLRFSVGSLRTSFKTGLCGLSTIFNHTDVNTMYLFISSILFIWIGRQLFAFFWYFNFYKFRSYRFEHHLLNGLQLKNNFAEQFMLFHSLNKICFIAVFFELPQCRIHMNTPKHVRCDNSWHITFSKKAYPLWNEPVNKNKNIVQGEC